MLIVYFAVQKVLSLMQSSLSIFAFVICAFTCYQINHCFHSSHESVFFPCFFWSAIVSDLRFRSLTHFELVFVYGVR